MRKAASAISDVPIKPTFTIAMNIKPAKIAPVMTHDTNAAADLALR
jgi:hypothetical protein